MAKTTGSEFQPAKMLQIGLTIIGWAVVIAVFFYRPKWLGIVFGIGFFGWICLAFLFLLVGFLFFKGKEAKAEGGWLFAIFNVIGLLLFIVLWFLLGFHVN